MLAAISKTPTTMIRDIARDYSLEGFITDVLLCMNNFGDISVRDISPKGDLLEFRADFLWQLHGHVKPVTDIRHYAGFYEDGNICLL